MSSVEAAGGGKLKNAVLTVIGVVAIGVTVISMGYGILTSGIGDGRPTAPSGPTLVVGTPSADSTHWKTVVSVTNISEPRGYKIVGVQCTWFSGGAAIDSSGVPVMNIPQGQTAHASATGPYSERNVDRVSCRVDYARPN